MSVFCRIRATKIGQRKAFYWQRILESSCVRKEIIEIDILVISMNGSRKILQSIRIASIYTSFGNKEVEPVKPFQMKKIYSSEKSLEKT